MISAARCLFAQFAGASTPLGQWLLLVWLFVLGTALGSFANVVVYRLPRRKNLAWPPSHCPNCGHAIRWYDNVPILGWLLLDGKCRDCQTPISPRYLFVETLFGILLATLGWLEMVERHAHLPLRPLTPPSEFPPSGWIMVAYHFFLVVTLMCAGLIEIDGKRVPRRLLMFAMFWGFALPIVWTGLRPVPLTFELPDRSRISHALFGMAEGLAGVAAGTLLGCLAWPGTSHRPGRAQSQVSAVLALMTVGAFLGWQAVSGIAALTMLCLLCATLLALAWPVFERPGWNSWLAGVTFVWLTFWSTIARALPSVASDDELWLLVGSGAWVALGAVCVWRIRRLRHRPREPAVQAAP